MDLRQGKRVWREPVKEKRPLRLTEAPLEAQGSSLRASVLSTTTGEPLKGKAQLPQLAL